MSSTINAPMAAPPPGVLAATQPLIQVVGRQRDPDLAAHQIGKKIEHEVVVMRRQSAQMDATRIATLMHRRVDRHMVDRDKRDPHGTADVKCSRGCNACCYQNVSVSEPEARLAFESAHQAGHKIDAERVRKQATHGMQAYQDELTHAERRCVMLREDGDCAIYANRPSACRTYRVVSEPALCDTVSNAHGIILSLTTPYAEVVVSAAMRSFRYGSFAAFLLEFGGAAEAQIHPTTDHQPEGVEA